MFKVIFDHLPKCGGTSVRRFLTACVGEERVSPTLKHVTVARALRLFEKQLVVTGHFSGQVLEHLHPDFRYVTLLRHPVDRIVSMYYYERSHDLGSPGAIVARSMSLRDYVSQTTGPTASAVENNMTLHFAAARGELLNSGDMLSAAVANLSRYDVVGILEEVDGFFDALCARFAWRRPEGTFFENRTPGRPRLSDVDPEVRAIIEARNGIDIELYGAACELARRGVQPANAVGAAPAPTDDVADRDTPPVHGFSLELRSVNGLTQPPHRIASGDPLRIVADLGVPLGFAARLVARLRVRDQAGEVLYAHGVPIAGPDAQTGKLSLEIGLDMRLGQGEYVVDFVLQRGSYSQRTVMLSRRRWITVEIYGYRRDFFSGLVDLSAHWTTSPLPETE